MDLLLPETATVILKAILTAIHMTDNSQK